MSERERAGPSESNAPSSGRAQAERLLRAWKIPEGWRYWSCVNNSEIGIWYSAVTCGFFLFAGALALLMRAQLAFPAGELLAAGTYNQLFTLHGSAMMFLFAIPIFEAIAVTLLPQMLGARDLPFPRLAVFGFWCFLIGGLFLCGSIFLRAAPEGGWFMYPPLTSAFQPGIGADIWLLGFSFIEVAAIASAVEIVIGALKCRPPGMRLGQMPLYAWYTLVAAVMVLFAFPPLIAGSALLELERAFGWPFFDPARGGDPLLWQHLFWLFGHPDVYIVFLPSVALVAMILPTFARRPMVGYGWVVLAAVGTGFLAFGLWVHHMYVTGLPGISLGLFSAASTAIGIPTAVQLFCFLATLLLGRVVVSLPMLWIFGGMAIFVLGGLSGVMVAIAPFDFQAHDTFFVVAHLHFVMIGGAVFPILAGIYYYFPLLRGKSLSERLGRSAFWLTFVGFNLTFLPMHWTGLAGMQRRVFTYPPDLGLDGPNLVSSAGALVLGLGFLVVAWDVVRPKGAQPLAPRNPWSAGTLEWASEMPGQPWGIRSIPQVESRYPLWDQPGLLAEIDEGRGYLPDAEEGLRETLVTSAVDATPLQVQRLPGPSFLPLAGALTLAGFFVFGTFHAWTPALGSLALALSVFLCWLWTGTALIPEKEDKDAGRGLRLPLYASGSASVGWWGMCTTMLADLTAFAAFVFGYFFFWTVREDFPPGPDPGPGAGWPALAALLLVGAWGATLLARRWNREDRAAAFHAAIGAGALLSVAGAAALIAGPWRAGLDPTSHSYPATVWLLVVWTALHVAVGLIMQLYCLARRLAGRMTARHDADIANVALYWHFTLITALVTVAVVAGFPVVA